MSNRKIKDAGAIIPNAKKHLARKRKTSESELSLSGLFPEPNWEGMRNSGHSIEAICFLTAVYVGLRKKPRAYAFKDITPNLWESSYEKTMDVLINLFQITKTPQDVELFRERFDLNMGIPDTEGLSFSQYYSLFAAGRGENRSIHQTLSMSNRQYCLKKWLGELGWPENKKAIKVKKFPVEFTDGTWGLCKPTSKGYSYLDSEVFDQYEEVISAFHDNAKSKGPRAYNPQKRKFDLDRKDIVKTDVTGDDIINTFGFRGVQYGRSMSDKERQLWLNNVYHALYVFCRILNFPNKKWIGLGGIGIAFGARGSGNASAHYEPDLQVINLTRRSGPSGLAHEWFHAFDHRLSKKLSLYNFGGYDFASESIQSHCKESLIQTEIPTHYKTLRSLFNVYRQHGIKSNFIKQANNLTRQHGGKQYWSEIIEVYARCFEAYVEDKLNQLAIECPWLVLGTLEEDYPIDKRNMHPYPVGQDRKDFYSRWEQFFNGLFKPKKN